jgi:hypothetical protein
VRIRGGQSAYASGFFSLTLGFPAHREFLSRFFSVIEHFAPDKRAP